MNRFKALGRVLGLLLPIAGILAAEPAAKAPHRLLKSDIIGTWRLVEHNGEPCRDEVYLQFQPDGVSRIWGSQKNLTSSKDGIAVAKFILDGDHVRFLGHEGPDHSGNKIEIVGEFMSFYARDGFGLYRK